MGPSGARRPVVRRLDERRLHTAEQEMHIDQDGDYLQRAWLIGVFSRPQNRY